MSSEWLRTKLTNTYATGYVHVRKTLIFFLSEKKYQLSNDTSHRLDATYIYCNLQNTTHCPIANLKYRANLLRKQTSLFAYRA